MNTYSFMSISYNLHLSQNNSLQKGERPKLDCSMQEGRIAMLPFVRNPNKNKKTQERKFSSSSFLFLWSNIIFSLSLSFWHRFLPPLLLFFLAKQTLTSSLLSLSLSLSSSAEAEASKAFSPRLTSQSTLGGPSGELSAAAPSLLLPPHVRPRRSTAATKNQGGGGARRRASFHRLIHSSWLESNWRGISALLSYRRATGDGWMGALHGSD